MSIDRILTPLLLVVIEPADRADRERLDRGLDALIGEDLTMRVLTGSGIDEDHRVVIACMGELQLAVIVDRLRRGFAVEATVGRPQVAYKERVTCAADGEGRFMQRAGGRGHYAHAKVHLYPGESESGYVFANQLVGNTIPAEFIQPIEDAINEALMCGVVAGFPMDDARVVLHGGSYHDVDSSAAAFRIAGGMAIQDAMKNAKPVLVEPVMRVEVMAPTELVSQVANDLERRRGEIRSLEDRDGVQHIDARVPLSEMFGYAYGLRARTQGRGAFSMELAYYQPFDPDEMSGGDRGSSVRAPLAPRPAPRSSSVALPEPADEDGTD